jgi:diaminohydroxyphosphoribosylaminopyrimidine deaminase/5-amino-6-(5-phosphoribosylamino)uracil reductase
MNHQLYIQRCFDLARLGAGSVSPNPMVGAVLVYENRIIGEGWHQRYGQAHAEVNTVNSVRPEDRKWIEHSTLYVSLEPCCIYGNTPPCTDLILRYKIPKVVISCLDHSPAVNGRGVEILKSAGVEVISGILEEKGDALSAIRNTFVSARRPYIVLKFARSKDGFLGANAQQTLITNSYSQRLVHKWRSELDAILVGTQTALIDNPKLNNRLWFGRSPLRIAFDRELRIPAGHFLLDGREKTWIVTEKSPTSSLPNLAYITLKFDVNLLPDLLNQLLERRISSLFVEGGARTLAGFIEGGWWDEARIFTGNKLLKNGISAPFVTGTLLEESTIGDDMLTIISNPAARPLNFA